VTRRLPLFCLASLLAFSLHAQTATPVPASTVATPAVQAQTPVQSAAQSDEAAQDVPPENTPPIPAAPVAALPASTAVEWTTLLRGWQAANPTFFPGLASGGDVELAPADAAGLKSLPALKKGSHGPQVNLLVRVLVARGFMPAPVNAPVEVMPVAPNTPVAVQTDAEKAADATQQAEDAKAAHTETRSEYDASVAEGVRLAQDYFGLVTDGIAGPQLYHNLAVTSTRRQGALDSWADALDADLATARSEGALHAIVVNIPSATLHVIDLQTGKTVLESRVIVGMPTRKTPVFRTNVVNLKYNPDWNPPPSLIKRGRHYMPPGVKNPLGVVRFSTNNNLNIYLHDTDEHELFERAMRFRSSGCIRVQQYRALASTLSGVPVEEVDREIAVGKIHFKKIAAVPVFVTYSLIDSLQFQTPDDQTFIKVGVFDDPYHAVGGNDPVVGAELLN
jgi:murein L,D-transpeptidase YcbB/YkuD